MVDVERIYNAAFKADEMPRLLDYVMELLDAQAGFLAWSNLSDQSKFEVQVGNDPAYLLSYMQTYWQHDTMRPVLYDAPEDKIMVAHELLNTPEVQTGVFYREWLAPQGIVDNMAINLFKRPELIATLAIMRKGDAAPFSPDDIARLGLALPHLKRAIFIKSRLIQSANITGAYQQVMHNARNGIVLLNGLLGVVDVAWATQQVTGLKAGQTLGGGMVDRAMIEAIQSGQPVAVTLDTESGGRTLLCVSQPIQADSFGDMAEGAGVRHAVHVIGIDQPLSIGFNAMARLYELTPTEARVMADALATADIKGVGDRLGMGHATVRTHLHRIYDKTGASGLTALALRAHRFALPADETLRG